MVGFDAVVLRLTIACGGHLHTALHMLIAAPGLTKGATDGDDSICALFLASLRFCVHYCIDRDTVQKKKTALCAVFLL